MIEEKNYNDRHGEYRSNDAIANSDLKYLHNPLLFHLNKKGEFQDKPDTKAQLFGRAFEDMINLSEDEFFQVYHVENPGIVRPASPAQHNFCNQLVDNEDIRELDIISAYKNSYTTYNRDKASSLFEQLEDHIKDLKRSRGKTIVPGEDFATIDSMLFNFNEHPIIKKHFFGGIYQLMRGYQVITDKPSIFGIRWKGEIDYITIHRELKTIYIWDLKTTSSPLGYFHNHVKKYKYYRQLALYRLLITDQLEKGEFIKGENDPSGWNIYCRIVACEKIYPYQTAVIPVPHNVLKIGEKELSEAAYLIKWYQLNGWDRRKSEVVNENLLIPDWHEVFEKLS